MSQLLRGTFTPLVTPFTRDDAIDFAALERLIDLQLAAGVEGLIMLATTGEGPTVGVEEFQRIVQFTIEKARPRSKVLTGVGSNDTRTTLEQARRAAAMDVDGLLVVCPYYNRPTQAGLQDHFLAVADAVPVPQILYNIAGRTGVNIETDTLLGLSEHPNIVGVKEASDDIDQVMDVIARRSEDFAVLSGCDHLNFPLLCLGGDGVISTLANLVPGEVKALVDSALAEDLAAARRLHNRLLPLARGCFIESNPIPVKTALAWQGKLEAPGKASSRRPSACRCGRCRKQTKTPGNRS
jgi:4-hydroxy-tetrahydrodipicolinate synthase